MYSVKRRSLQCFCPHIRLYSDAAAPRVPLANISQRSQNTSRVVSSFDGISIPHRDAITQKKPSVSYKPNITYLQGGATSKSSLATRLASRASNAPVTSSLLDKVNAAQPTDTPDTTPRYTQVPDKAPVVRAQIVVAPRKESVPRRDDVQPRPDLKKRVFANDNTRPPPRGDSAPFRGGQRGGSFTNRSLPPRPPRPLPPNGRGQFMPRQPSGQNASSRGKSAPRKKARRQQQAEEKEAGEALRIIDQLPPDMAFTPDFTPSDWKSLLQTSSEVHRPRFLFEHGGGDYSRFVPHTIRTAHDAKAATISVAETTLSQQKDVGLTQRVKAVDMIKQSVGFKLTKGAQPVV